MNVAERLIRFIRLKYTKHPLAFILITALTVRLIAAFFSRGYGMHDDHFLVIEASQSWVDGTDYNNWLPANSVLHKPDGHSFFYVGLHYLLFSVMHWLGMSNPDHKMYIVRILHALLSLIVVWAGYKTVYLYAGRKTANTTGWMLALLWFMPFMAVRNLAEVVAIPFLMLGIWITERSLRNTNAVFSFLIAGIVTGLAVSVRFQTILFVGGMGLALLFMKKFKEALIFGAGSIISIALLQGGIDLMVWGRPFAEFREYIIYNLDNKYSYGNNNYFMYPSLIIGLLIPPVSIFLIFGFFREWKKHMLLFFPVIIYLLFHEYFPNKQERFILTVLPMIIMLGVVGCNRILESSSFWQRQTGLIRGSMIFFWIVNFFLLSFTTTAYTKKSRVEAMLYLNSKNEDIRAILVDNNNDDGTVFVPMFYLGSWIESYQLSENLPVPDSMSTINQARHQHKIKTLHYFDRMPADELPRFVLFYNDRDLKGRITRIESYFPRLSYETTIIPSFIDRLMYRLNPVNVNQTVIIYRIRYTN